MIKKINLVKNVASSDVNISIPEAKDIMNTGRIIEVINTKTDKVTFVAFGYKGRFYGAEFVDSRSDARRKGYKESLAIYEKGTNIEGFYRNMTSKCRDIADLMGWWQYFTNPANGYRGLFDSHLDRYNVIIPALMSNKNLEIL